MADQASAAVSRLASRDVVDVAWTYHRATCGWTYNTSQVVDDRPEQPERVPGLLAVQPRAVTLWLPGTGWCDAMAQSTSRSTVVVTGAFGNVGANTVGALLSRGHHVVAHDLPTLPHRAAAVRLRGRGVETVWGDVTDSTTVAAVVDRAGRTQHLPAPRLVTDPVDPVDPYGRTKPDAEEVRGRSAAPRTSTGRSAAADAAGAPRRTGESPSPSRIHVGMLREAVFSTAPFHCDWVDTRESQQLLGFQRRSFADYLVDLHRRYRWRRPVVWAVAPMIRWAMLRGSPYWQASRGLDARRRRTPDRVGS